MDQAVTDTAQLLYQTKIGLGGVWDALFNNVKKELDARDAELLKVWVRIIQRTSHIPVMHIDVE